MAEAAKKKKVFDGRYEVLSIVGRGAASVVYHARHVGALTSEVALKVLVKQASSDGKTSNSDLLRKEALAMVSARHKYVVRLDDFHSVGDLCYLAMEYAALGDVRKFVAAREGKLNLESGEVFLSQTAEALDFVHRVGIVHRDIKPDNILVINEKEIRLADFGVAVLPGETASMKDLQAGVGTMSYMAPEVIEGISYDKRSDIYSLGVSFYELFSGIHPFEKAPLIKQLEVREDKNVPPLHAIAPQVPLYISNVIMQAISYDPARRFSSCQDLIQSLMVNKSQSVGKPQSTRALVEPTAEPVQRPANQRTPIQAAADKTVHPLSVEEPPRRKESEIKPRSPASPAPGPDLLAGSSPRATPAGTEQTPPAEEENNIVEFTKPETTSNPIDAPPKQPPPRSQPSKLMSPSSTPPQSHPLQEKGKPKRSLEDLRKLARETKSSPAPSESRAPESKKPLRTTPPGTSRGRSLSSFFMLVIAVALAYILYGYFFSGPRIQDIPESPIETTTAPVQNVEPKTLSFPNLPGGIFHGSIKGLLLDHALPLSLISMGPERGVIVVIGIQGWTPQLVPAQSGTSSLRVASNGMILDLNGQSSEAGVKGEIQNIVTGEKGSWSVERSR